MVLNGGMAEMRGPGKFCGRKKGEVRSCLELVQHT